MTGHRSGRLATFEAALARATVECAAFLANRPDDEDAAVLNIVGPLIAVARPKSRLRATDWRFVSAALSRGLITVEWFK